MSSDAEWHVIGCNWLKACVLRNVVITRINRLQIHWTRTIAYSLYVCVCVLGVSALPGTCRTKSGDVSGTRESRRAVPGGHPEQGHLCTHPQGNPHTGTHLSYTQIHLSHTSIHLTHTWSHLLTAGHQTPVGLSHLQCKPNILWIIPGGAVCM